MRTRRLRSRRRRSPTAACRRCSKYFRQKFATSKRC